VLKTDGSIGAVLHINPNDEPTANQPSTLVFEFKDKRNNFSSKECNCLVSILANGKTVYSQPLFQDTQTKDTYAAITYIFPESNIYTVQITGKSLSGTSFQPFHLSWDIRVAAATNTENTTQTNTLSFSPFFILFTIVLIGGIILFVRNKATKST
jgi:hypothetical protein